MMNKSREGSNIQQSTISCSGGLSLTLPTLTYVLNKGMLNDKNILQLLYIIMEYSKTINKLHIADFVRE